MNSWDANRLLSNAASLLRQMIYFWVYSMEGILIHDRPLTDFIALLPSGSEQHEVLPFGNI